MKTQTTIKLSTADLHKVYMGLTLQANRKADIGLAAVAADYGRLSADITAQAAEGYKAADHCIAIQTKYYGPTNTRGGRIGAHVVGRGRKGQAFKAYDHALSARENHEAAADMAMAKAFGSLVTREAIAAQDSGIIALYSLNRR